MLVGRLDAETIKRPNMTDSDIGVLHRMNYQYFGRSLLRAIGGGQIYPDFDERRPVK